MAIKEEFLKACQDGDFDTVQRLIQHNYHPKKWSRGFHQLTGKEIDLNIVSSYGSTPLMLAAGNGFTDIVELLIPLLDAPSLNTINKNNFSALMLAAKHNHVPALERLLKAPGLLVNQTNCHGYTALTLAATANGCFDALECLLATPGIEVNALQPGKSPLMWAAQKGHHNVVERLLAVPGINIHHANQDGETAISLAFEHGHPTIVELLERHGAVLPEHLRAEANHPINGAQSVHEVSVHVSVSESAKNLVQQYVFTQDEVDSVILNIISWLNNDFKDPNTLPKEYRPEWLPPAKRCVDRLRAINFTDQRSNVTMQQALAFVWTGINNPQALGKDTPALSKEEILNRQITFLKYLFEIQREYNLVGGANPIDKGGDDLPTCVSGSFNKLISVLNSVGHFGVQIISVTKALIAEQVPNLTKQAFAALSPELKARFSLDWENENGKSKLECLNLLKNWVKTKLHELFDSFRNEIPDLDDTITKASENVEHTDMDEIISQETKKCSEETKEQDTSDTCLTASFGKKPVIFYRHSDPDSDSKEEALTSETELCNQFQKSSLNSPVL